MVALSTALRRLRTGRRSSEPTTLDAPERDPPRRCAIACGFSPLSTLELHQHRLNSDVEGSRELGGGREGADVMETAPDQDQEEEGVDPKLWPYPPLACASPALTPPACACIMPLSPAQSGSPFSSTCNSQLSLVASLHASSSSIPSSVAAPAPPLGLTISTRLDSHGRRVLTSRRRLSIAPSPTKCRKNKATFGVGDGESEGVKASDEYGAAAERSHEVEEERLGFPALEKVASPIPLHLAPTSVPLDHIMTLSFVATDGSTPVSSRFSIDSATSELSRVSPRQIRRPPLSPSNLRPLFLPTTPSDLSPSPASTPEHQPIKVFTPPPPLYASSPTRSTFAAHFTRSNTLVHTSSSSSNNSIAGPSSCTNRLSLHSRTLKRLSRNSVSYPSPSSAATLPIEPPTMSMHISRRRSSSSAPLTSLERQTSVSSETYSASSPSMPPTPGSGGCSHERFLLESPPIPTAELVASPAFDPEAKLSHDQHPAPPLRRPSVVSFELPPESPTELLRRERPMSHDYSRRTSSSPNRTRGHRRALSEGKAVGLGLDLHPSWINGMASMLAEEQWERGKLVVINPDVPRVPIPSYHKPIRVPPRPPRSPPCPAFGVGLAC